MNPLVKKFFSHGLMAASGGPVVLALVYFFLGQSGNLSILSPGEVVRGILTVTLMAFIAGGIPVIYEVERLSLLSATFLHALTLYADYLLIYLWNGWLRSDRTPIFVFTLIFFAGYALIWLLIFCRTRAGVARMNRSMVQRRASGGR